ncbi:MAG TPA: hypothetical protein VKV33_07910 [Streptosporangiaceae bacterium]|nr:hypothetical protein [Streptosporangiaceae bacterium]
MADTMTSVRERFPGPYATPAATTPGQARTETIAAPAAKPGRPVFHRAFPVRVL